MENQKHIEAYQDLFDHMMNEHGLTLLQSELDEIMMLSQKAVEKYNKACEVNPQLDTDANNIAVSLPDKFGHNDNWKYCPGCKKEWEEDDQSFGCSSCGFVRR